MASGDFARSIDTFAWFNRIINDAIREGGTYQTAISAFLDCTTESIGLPPQIRAVWTRCGLWLRGQTISPNEKKGRYMGNFTALCDQKPGRLAPVFLMFAISCLKL